MYSQGRNHSNSRATSRETSNASSRRTTLSDSWEDIMSNTIPGSQRTINDSNQFNIHSREDGRSSVLSSTIQSVDTVISKKRDIDRTSNNRSHENLTQNQRKPWINPYWGPNWNPNTAGTQSKPKNLNKNTNIKRSPSPMNIHQVVPGSILVNDQDEMDDLSWTPNMHIKAIVSNNPLNPSGKYIADDNGSSDGYVTPTLINRQILTSSPELSLHSESDLDSIQSSSSSDANTRSQSTFNRQQTFSKTTDNKNQTWVNPYWGKKLNQNNFQSTQENNRIRNQKSASSNNSIQNSWVNPYWGPKSNQINSQFTQQNNRIGNQKSASSNNSIQNSWVNPYWGPKSNQTNSQFTQQNNRIGNQKPVASNNLTQNSWVNPYWGTKPSGKSTSSSEIKKSQASTVPQQDNWQYQNCSWKDKNASDSDFNITSLNESLSCEFKFTPIPSFYKRLYPPYPSSSSSIPIVDMEHYGILNQTIDDNEDIPFTIDRQGVAHYRAESSSSNIMNTTANIPSSSTTSQYPILSPKTHNNILSSETTNPALVSQITNSMSSSYPNNMTSSPLQNLSNEPSSLFNYYPSMVSSSSSSSAIVLTEADLNSIQHALHLLNTSPNVISVMENSTQVLPSSNISHPNNPSSSLASLFTPNKAQQSQPPPSTSFSANKQDNPPLYAYISNSEQMPLLSTPSYPSNQDDTLSRLMAKGTILHI
ncbi:unnamed protein product [Rotaria sordida]|uniref:Uncharacterized protein n=2 Tax=Rotaria sordida TaxID=392033 RepID=A0A819VW55_9BILA|nr:unnamed protein product [Rotaria sordida]